MARPTRCRASIFRGRGRRPGRVERPDENAKSQKSSRLYCDAMIQRCPGVVLANSRGWRSRRLSRKGECEELCVVPSDMRSTSPARRRIRSFHPPMVKSALGDARSPGEGSGMLRMICCHCMLAFATGLAVVAAANAETTGNIALTSDYVSRGVSYSDNDPAVQGGLDWSHGLGFYAGVWGSNVSFGTPAHVELDVYTGITRPMASGLGWDSGLAYYTYPGRPRQITERLTVASRTKPSLPSGDTRMTTLGRVGMRCISKGRSS